MKEVDDVKKKLADSEARQSELMALNQAHALRLQEAEKTIAIASEIITRMRNELEKKSCKAKGVKRKAKKLKKTLVAKEKSQ